MVIIAITALLIFLVFKFSKSTGARIAITVLLVIVSLIALAFGSAVVTLFKVGESITESVEQQSQTDTQEQLEAKPKVKDTQESKNYFAPTDIVTGNGVEMQVTNLYKVVDKTEFEFIDDETYCAVDFRLKNTHSEVQSIYSGQFELKQADGTVVPLIYPTDAALSPKFDSFTVELEPQKEIIKSVGYDCLKIQGPLYFEYSGGAFLNFSFLTEKQEFTPIKYEVSFQ